MTAMTRIFFRTFWKKIKDGRHDPEIFYLSELSEKFDAV